jgi:MFS family permease
MLTPPQRTEKLHSVIRVASGNFLEMYDFMVFGYFSSAIGRAYFPTSSEFASLMLSMTTFAVGFMVRPLGAIFLGAYIDHIGRRKGLLLTLALMGRGWNAGSRCVSPVGQRIADSRLSRGCPCCGLRMTHRHSLS